MWGCGTLVTSRFPRTQTYCCTMQPSYCSTLHTKCPWWDQLIPFSRDNLIGPLHSHHCIFLLPVYSLHLKSRHWQKRYLVIYMCFRETIVFSWYNSQSPILFPIEERAQKWAYLILSSIKTLLKAQFWAFWRKKMFLHNFPLEDCWLRVEKWVFTFAY